VRKGWALRVVESSLPFVAWTGVLAIGLFTCGCQTHQCDVAWETEGTIAPTSGGMAIVGSTSISGDGTEIIWQSSPVVGQWLLFDGAHSLQFVFPSTLPAPYECYAWPAPDPPPEPWVATCCVDGNADGITVASGQLAAITQLHGSDPDSGAVGGFVVTNESCERFWLWVTAHFPLPSVPCAVDATDGGADDSSSE